MAEKILIRDSTPAALQAAKDLADSGLWVVLVEPGPFISGGSRLEGPAYTQDSQLLEVLKHHRIETRTNTKISQLSRSGNQAWNVDLLNEPRYVDLTRCTACGECLEVCPVTIPGTELKAIHFGGQPECAVISKSGVSPCSEACPAGIHVQGYVALTAAGRYQEAYRLIHQALPFPSVCGRVCNHYCEESCSRAQYDQAVNIMALKRFVADRVYQEQDREGVREALLAARGGEKFQDQRIAVIGAGPAGLTAARDLARAGYKVTVFDANSQPGGMMRVGIPPHRLDYGQLAWEIEQILLEGVELQLNTWVDDIPSLLESGFGAVLLATGAHRAVKISIENADHPDNWLSLDFLKKVCLEERIDLSGRKVIVLGGGDVAMDAARSAIRLGQPDVRIVCRGLRASFNEIKEAEEEGIEIIRGRVFKRVALKEGRIAGVECLEAEVGGVVDGKRQFSEIPGTEHLIPGDLVIWAVGQRPDFSFLPADESILSHSEQGIQADQRMMTSLEGVFTAGDVRRGTTFFVVDAVGEGHRAARAIMNYLEGNPAEKPAEQRPRSVLNSREIENRLKEREGAAVQRVSVPCIAAGKRSNNFLEVEQTISERQALRESGRCLACGPCSECMACVEVCQPGAILHQQVPLETREQFSEVIGLQDPAAGPEASGVISLAGEDPLAGSAAAFEILARLRTGKEFPPANREPAYSRGNGTGLVLCGCGGKISSAIDTAGLREEASSWPEISLAAEVPFSCTPEGADFIRSLILDHHLERLVLAACSCCDLDQICFSCTYQRVRCKENLGVFSDTEDLAEIVFVNIREGCALVHPRSRKKATGAARDLIRSALARKPAARERVPAPRVERVLVVGEGESARVCLSALNQLGLDGEHLAVLSGEIIRSGGSYSTRHKDRSIEADALVLAPASGAELDYITGAVTIAGGHPLRLSGERDWDPLALGMVICPPDQEPDQAGRGAAARLAAWTARIEGSSQPSARVDPLRCRNCGTCLDACGVGVPAIIRDERGDHAWINPKLCLGCGVCAARCPSGAITPGTLSDAELERVLAEVLR